MLRSVAISAFTRVFDALWQRVSKQGPPPSFETPARNKGMRLRLRLRALRMRAERVRRAPIDLLYNRAIDTEE